MSLSLLRRGVARPSQQLRPAFSLAAAAARLPVALPAALPTAARRTVHTTMPCAFRSSAWLGGAAPAAGEEFHGSDFLSRANVQRRVLLVLNEVDKIDKSKLSDLDSSFKTLGLDSLDEVELVIMLEDEFVIDIQDEVASSLLTINDAINYIASHPFAANDEVHH